MQWCPFRVINFSGVKDCFTQFQLLTGTDSSDTLFIRVAVEPVASEVDIDLEVVSMAMVGMLLLDPSLNVVLDQTVS
ncbi:hypothetical protein Bpfe_029272 [Biomphalaria pfeifferi]|uniref:Uncharacterized protein n=1 Tax=Biomphalaria pfeifferi TaxID=112525 RepID=A0AAD8ATF9_BIOPF|nr:hypothetical protein Bpfe_029272 [Biomphalaria pfeifferi]